MSPDAVFVTVATIYCTVTVVLWLTAMSVSSNDTMYVTEQTRSMKRLGALISIIAPVWPVASVLAAVWAFTALMRTGTLPRAVLR